jgi:hypothetical protein
MIPFRTLDLPAMSYADNKPLQHADTNAFDLLIKYSAVFVVITYWLGFAEEKWFFNHVTRGSDFPIADPRYFLYGSFVLSLVVLPAMLAVLIVGARVKAAADRSLLRVATAPVILIVAAEFIVVFSIALWGAHSWLREALAVASLAGLTVLMLSIFLLSPERLLAVTVRKQLETLFSFACLFSLLATASGQVHWRNALQPSENESACILVAPDRSRSGTEGMVFPKRRANDNSAALSSPVQIIFEGERMYVLRLNNNTIVRLNREKVWGFAPAP